MKTVVFKEDYLEGGRHYKAGTLIQLSDSEADRLIEEGVAEERQQHGPRETKREEGEETADKEPEEPAGA
jgi:hypothetical protein